MPLAWQLGCQDRPEFRTPSDADSLGLGQLGPRWHGVNRWCQVRTWLQESQGVFFSEPVKGGVRAWTSVLFG